MLPHILTRQHITEQMRADFREVFRKMPVKTRLRCVDQMHDVCEHPDQFSSLPPLVQKSILNAALVMFCESYDSAEQLDAEEAGK